MSEHIAALEAALQAGPTDGPWEWISNDCLWGGERGCEEILKAGDDGKPFGLHSALIEHHWDAAQAKANRDLIAAANPAAIRAVLADVKRLRAEVEALRADAAVERSSRRMFVLRLEGISASGDRWITVQSVFALLNDCDFLAARERDHAAIAKAEGGSNG